jgi:uncharacterized caspase-like protein
MKMHGVFVGINSYSDKRISSLRFARADAEDFFTAANKSLLEPEKNLQLITDDQATKQFIFLTIGERLARQAAQEDLVLLYFAGHGTPETEETIDKVSRYIVTFDTDYENVFATAIDMEKELVRLIERIQSKLVVTIMDTCFSGQAGGRTFEGPNLARYRADWRGQLTFSNLDLGEGRVILTATDSNELAREDSSLGHGIFTYFLLQTLTSPAEEPLISLGALYERVYNKVREHSRGRQHPVMNGRVKMARLPFLSMKTPQGDAKHG